MTRQTPTDDWPTTGEATVVSQRDTQVGGAPPPPPAAPPPDRRIGAGMLLGLGALALVAAGLVIAWLLTHRDNTKQTTTVVVTTNGGKTALPPKVSVPRLVGLKEQQALVRVGQIGLRPKEVFRPTKQPKGVVVSQKPQEATELPRGGKVTLVVDSGAPRVGVPDLAGTSLAAAQRKLDALGLQSTKTQVTSTAPVGTIVDQSPKAGAKLAKGSTVTLSIAKAAPAQTTPTTTPAATTTQPTSTQPTSTQSTSTPPTSTQPTNTTHSTNTTQSTTTSGSATTTSQSPTTTAPATPPQPQNASMPDVSGQKEAAAVSALGKAGILASLAFVPSSEPLGTVVQAAKPAGTTVPFHSHVQINLSRGSNDNPAETVPNVIGQTLQQAVSTVNGAHLRLIFLKFPVTSRTQAGKIVQQSPLSGAQAPQNAQVVVYLGAFKQG
ncbi:MAG: PASTA domain-containing protein [Gaiellaceae bacterium]